MPAYTGSMSLELEQVAGILAALGEPARLRLAMLLRDGELTVSELTEATQMSQPRVSRHLKILVGAGVLQRFREAHWMYYRLRRNGAAADLARAVLQRVAADHAELAADARRLAAVLDARDAANAAPEGAASHSRARASTSAEWAAVEHAIRQLAARTAESGGAGIGELLDIGTGTGRLLSLLAQDAERAEGLDNSVDMRQEARAVLRRSGLANTRVREGDMYDLPYTDVQFDTVLLGSMLSDATDPILAVAEAARVLRVGGHLLVVELLPAGEAPRVWTEQIAQWLLECSLETLESQTIALTDANVVLNLGRRISGVESRVDLAIA